MNYDILIKLVTLIAAYIFILYACDKIFKLAIKKNKDIQMKFMQSIAKAIITVIFICITGMLFETTRDISKTLLQSSALFVAVAGFSAQQVLADVVSGMMISYCKPYNIGERITLKSSEITGIVEDITIRHTVIRCFDNTRVIIPNSVINKDIISNSDFETECIGNYLEIGVSYDSNTRLAMQIMKDVVLRNRLVQDKSKGSNCDREIYISVKSWEKTGIILKTTVWTKTVDDNFIACSELRLSIKEAFDIAGIKPSIAVWRVQ